ncbi:MAG: hypothetical protein CL698_00215 [Chloroflexi bacterium]|nr:hypothetical protein [Chloroflexota bacterium]
MDIVDYVPDRRGIQTNIGTNNSVDNVDKIIMVVDIFNNSHRLLIIRQTYTQILQVDNIKF